MANDTKARAARLGAIPLFSTLKKKHLLLVADLAKEVAWPKGKVGVTEGSNATAFFLVLEGSVAVTKAGKRKRKLGAGESFGEIALLSGGKRTATVTAAEDTKLLAIGRGAITPLIKSNSEFSMDLVKAMATRLADDG